MAPLAIHSCASLILGTAALLFALVLRGLREVTGKEHAYIISWIETIDIGLAVATLCLFGTFTLALLAIRLGKALKTEWNR